MGLILSREEMRELTGCAQRRLQRENLDAMGVPYKVNADGWPVVDWQAYDQVMGVAAVNDERVEAILDLERL